MGSTQTKPKVQKKIQLNKASFNFVKIAGKGGFGRVWKVIDKKTKKVFALKVIDKAKVMTKKSVNSLLSRLVSQDHLFIVNMKAAFQDRQNLYLLMDYLESGDLRYYHNRTYNFSQQQIKFIIRCIMQGLKCIHSKNIMHRDLKPQNIIFDKNGYCRITDMGIARYWRAQNNHETSGTPGYMSPEVLLKKNHSFGVDYYAVGIIAFQLFMKKRPYMGRDRAEIKDQMFAKEVKIPLNFRNMSKQSIDFINKLIQRDVRKRLGYNGISQILNHPWLKISKQDHHNFLNQTLPSPIIPLQTNLPYNLGDLTEPDDIWKQNILILKLQKTQLLFKDYDWTPTDKIPSNKAILVTQDSVHYMTNLTTRE